MGYLTIGFRHLLGLILLTGLGCQGPVSPPPESETSASSTRQDRPAQSMESSSSTVIDPTQDESGVSTSTTDEKSDADPSLAELYLGRESIQVLKGGAVSGPKRPEEPLQEPGADPSAAVTDTFLAPNPDHLQRAGLRQLAGKYVTIYTDLPPAPEVDRLPHDFDHAVPQWASFLGIARPRLEGWHLHGSIMREPARFREAGLLPEGLPPFPHGYQRGEQFWVHDQPTAYYRRHLMLHEGVHAIMRHFLGGTGPPWYREGMAELLATHRGTGRQLRVGLMPRGKHEVAGWGRIEAVRRRFLVGKAHMLRDIWLFPNEAYHDTEAYAWSWAAVAYLNGHPAYRQRFRRMLPRVVDESITFSQQLELLYGDELRELDEQWQIFIANIDYGYDFRRNAVHYGEGRPLPPQGATISVRAGQGWQSTGYRLETERSYLIRAEGQFQIANQGQPWISEAGGVTLRYHRGLPLGMLLGNVRTDRERPGLTNLTSPFPVGSAREVRPVQGGTLYLLINDHPAEYADNAGALHVQITHVESTPMGVPGAQEMPRAGHEPRQQSHPLQAASTY